MRQCAIGATRSPGSPFAASLSRRNPVKCHFPADRGTGEKASHKFTASLLFTAVCWQGALAAQITYFVGGVLGVATQQLALEINVLPALASDLAPPHPGIGAVERTNLDY